MAKLHSLLHPVWLMSVLVIMLTGCATSITKPPHISKAEIRNEERIQLNLLRNHHNF